MIINSVEILAYLGVICVVIKCELLEKLLYFLKTLLYYDIFKGLFCLIHGCTTVDKIYIALLHLIFMGIYPTKNVCIRPFGSKT